METPKHLSQGCQRAFAEIVDRYEITPDGYLVLIGALENFDRYKQARRLVTREGIVRADGTRHPACAVEQSSYKLFIAGLRHLGLDAGDLSALA